LSQPTTLIHGSTQVILLAIDPEENFIDVKSIAVASMLPLEFSGIVSFAFDTPQTDGFS
jgi:hypothetical protein